MTNGLRDPQPPHRWIFFILVFGLIAISILFIASRLFRHSEGLLGHNTYTSNTDPIIINLVGESLVMPQNMIRQDSQRTSEPQNSLDLFFHWPSLQGYNLDNQLAFTDISDMSKLVFVRLSSPQKHISSSERLYSVYSQHFIGSPKQGAAGLIGFKMDETSSYAGEIVYFKPDENPPYVVRCFQPQEQVPTICLREILLKNGLQASYRFRMNMLENWREIDATTQKMLNTMIIE
ncbi:MAG: hypothetical protein OIF56_03025 [Cohaesibacter sp.]|nr:hypothetical protein [Cohaesibacter sp.]MCV6602364.1 hypothetical protein [Cohaesibacter sp.]